MKKRLILAAALFSIVLALGCQSSKCNSNCADNKPIENPWDALMAADGWVQKTLW
ncbi:MAG: hypothetical protein WCY12_06425 [Candidatus Omnitrophota bacterium]